jgi:hypothetical protein
MCGRFYSAPKHCGVLHLIMFLAESHGAEGFRPLHSAQAGQTCTQFRPLPTLAHICRVHDPQLSACVRDAVMVVRCAPSVTTCCSTCFRVQRPMLLRSLFPSVALVVSKITRLELFSRRSSHTSVLSSHRLSTSLTHLHRSPIRRHQYQQWLHLRLQAMSR